MANRSRSVASNSEAPHVTALSSLALNDNGQCRSGLAHLPTRGGGCDGLIWPLDRDHRPTGDHGRGRRWCGRGWSCSLRSDATRGSTSTARRRIRNLLAEPIGGVGTPAAYVPSWLVRSAAIASSSRQHEKAHQADHAEHQEAAADRPRPGISDVPRARNRPSK
jgi:hypothetical protein